MSEKKKFTVYVGSVVLCVGVAVLLHYVSFTNPYLQSICHLLRPFIYIGLYLVWAISFQKRIIQKEPRRCLIMIAVMMVFWMLVRMCKFEIPYEMPTALRYAWYLYYIPMLLLPTVSLYLAFYIRRRKIINYRKDGVHTHIIGTTVWSTSSITPSSSPSSDVTGSAR